MSPRPPHGPRCRALAAPVLLCALCGCMSTLSGLDGRTRYACQAPEGITCNSVSGTYAHALPPHRPGQPADRAAATKPTGTPPPAPAPLAGPSPVPPPPPLLRSQARVLRLWFKPWEDTDQDLYDQSHVYVQIDRGRWLIDHLQRDIRQAHAPLRPPPPSATAPPPHERQDHRADPPRPGHPPPAASDPSPEPGSWMPSPGSPLPPQP